MLDDLIKYKEELEQAKDYGLFADGLISHFDATPDFELGKEGYSLTDIWNRVNNEQVAQKCEDTMRDAIVLLSKYDIPYANIMLASYPSFFVKKYVLEEARHDYDEGKNLHEFVLRRFKNNVLENVIPVRFIFDLDSMIIPAEYLPEGKGLMRVTEYIRTNRNSECIKEIEKFCTNSIFEGVINFDKFVNLMRKNGFSATATDNILPCFESYLSVYFEQIEREVTYDFYIGANFSRSRK